MCVYACTREGAQSFFFVFLLALCAIVYIYNAEGIKTRRSARIKDIKPEFNTREQNKVMRSLSDVYVW